LRHALRLNSLRNEPMTLPRVLSLGNPFSLRKFVKFLVWIFRYSIGMPAIPVARRIEHRSVDPVRCTDAIANKHVVSVWFACETGTTIFWQVALIASWL